MNRQWIRLAVTAAALHATTTGAQDIAVDSGAVEDARARLVERMVSEHGFERASVAAILDSAAINQDVLRAISRPAERVVPWYDYRGIFLTPARIEAGVEFWAGHADIVEGAASASGVDPEMLVAIIGIESLFGRRMGSYRVLDALSTLAFAYPPRASFFTSELEAFLVMSAEEGDHVLDALGSYAGAMGAGQFIPTSYRAYAVDGDGDGLRDLWDNWHDILASVANYFSEHGWRSGGPVAVPAEFAGADAPSPSRGLELDRTVGGLIDAGFAPSAALPRDERAMLVALEESADATEYWIGLHNFRVITRYNRSEKYALAAFQLAEAIREAYRGRLSARLAASPAEAGTRGDGP
jgi:membrane-bound lytic murein transglycosylase B